MNRAVFLDSMNLKIKNNVEKIILSQEAICRLQNKLELEVGVLKIDKEGVDIIVDLEHYDRIAGEIRKNLDEIRIEYKRLISIGAFKTGEAAQPPDHPILPKYQRLPK